jgi:hypothetical protein
VKGRRRVKEEIASLIMFGPLDITAEERRFYGELWAKHTTVPHRYWPTQYQWAQFFGVSEWTVARWVQHLGKKNMLRFERPRNIRDGNGGWKGPRKHPVIKLVRPESWIYKNGWVYLGARQGFITPDGKIVRFPPDVFSFPKAPAERP